MLSPDERAVVKSIWGGVSRDGVNSKRCSFDYYRSKDSWPYMAKLSSPHYRGERGVLSDFVGLVRPAPT